MVRGVQFVRMLAMKRWRKIIVRIVEPSMLAGIYRSKSTPGEILGIVGESGSGKSTMMKCLYFDETVTSGEGYMSPYQDGMTNIFEQSSQQQRLIRNTDSWHGIPKSDSWTEDGFFLHWKYR